MENGSAFQPPTGSGYLGLQMTAGGSNAALEASLIIALHVRQTWAPCCGIPRPNLAAESPSCTLFKKYGFTPLWLLRSSNPKTLGILVE